MRSTVTSSPSRFTWPTWRSRTRGRTTSSSSPPSMTASTPSTPTRPGLMLASGKVYVGWAAHADHGPAHGWLVGFDAKTLKVVDVFCASPNGTLNGFWQSGAAGAIDDANGDIYISNGNGTQTGITG